MTGMTVRLVLAKVCGTGAISKPLAVSAMHAKTTGRFVVAIIARIVRRDSAIG
jgi:hypothetical protein